MGIFAPYIGTLVNFAVVLGITKVRTANMVPTMFVAIGVEALLNWIF